MWGIGGPSLGIVMLIPVNFGDSGQVSLPSVLELVIVMWSHLSLPCRLEKKVVLNKSLQIIKGLAGESSSPFLESQRFSDKESQVFLIAKLPTDVDLSADRTAWTL